MATLSSIVSLGKASARTLLRLGPRPAVVHLLRRVVTGSLPPSIRWPRDRAALALEWLCRAHDQHQRRAVPAVFSLTDGWGPRYLETTGYIARTFLDQAPAFPGLGLRRRAISMLLHEVEMQHETGGVSERADSGPIIFNTGQVLLGWNRYLTEKADERILGAARRAAAFLVANQDENGAWTRFEHAGPRTYHSRVSWPLLEYALAQDDEQALDAARRNIGWVLAQQERNGWFRWARFGDDPSVLHFMAYTYRGLLESHRLLSAAGEDHEDILDHVLGALKPLRQASEENWVKGLVGLAPDFWGPEWEVLGGASCLTGNCQLANACFIVADVTGDAAWAEFGRSLVAGTALVQEWCPEIPDVHGAVPGSFPQYKGYCSWRFPNWAGKFFVDAIQNPHFLKGDPS